MSPGTTLETPADTSGCPKLMRKRVGRCWLLLGIIEFTGFFMVNCQILRCSPWLNSQRWRFEHTLSFGSLPCGNLPCEWTIPYLVGGFKHF